MLIISAYFPKYQILSLSDSTPAYYITEIVSLGKVQAIKRRKKMYYINRCPRPTCYVSLVAVVFVPLTLQVVA